MSPTDIGPAASINRIVRRVPSPSAAQTVFSRLVFTNGKLRLTNEFRQEPAEAWRLAGAPSTRHCVIRVAVPSIGSQPRIAKR